MTTPLDTTHPDSDVWADPGFTVRQSRFRNVLRILKQALKPLRGDKTVPITVGVVLIALSLGVGVAAYNTASNILFVTLSLLLSCLILSGILAWMNLHGVTWRLVVPARLRVGELASVAIDLVNTKKALPTYSLCFGLEAHPDGASCLLAQKEGLDPGQKMRLHWRFIPEQRGTTTIVISSLESLFPFGFLKKSISGVLKRSVITWPRRSTYSFDPAFGSVRQRLGHTVLARGYGSELVNLRGYRPGDPVRMVHWKASARLRRLMTRETSEERQNLYLIYLSSLRLNWPEAASFEAMLSLAATLAEDLFLCGQLWGTAVNDHPVRMIRSSPDLHSFLDRISCLQQVDAIQHRDPFPGGTVISFAPSSDGEISLYVGNSIAGTTTPVTT